MFQETPFGADGIEWIFSAEMTAVDRAAAAFQRRFGRRCAGDLFDVALALREMLINAVEHGNRLDPERAVRCRVEPEGTEHLRIDVTDEGEGFDRDGMRFRLPSDPLTDRHRGLALIHAVADTVTFNHKGNRISARFPCVPTDADGRIPQKRDSMEKHREMRILLVEDAAVTRNMEQGMLRELGHSNVLTAADGAEALRLLRERPDIDLVISDWNMPELTGMELLERIRSDERYAGLPFLMATAQAGRADRDRAMAAGATGVIPKPFDAEELREAIAGAFTGGRDSGAVDDAPTADRSRKRVRIVEEEERIRVTIASEPDLVDRAVRSAAVFAEGFDPAPFPDLEQVLRELMVNAMTHGNRNRPDKRIFCEVTQLRDDRFRVSVRDEGEGFHPHDTPALVSAAPKWEGASGLARIRAVCEGIDFNEAGTEAIVHIRRSRQTRYEVSVKGDRAVIRPSGNITAASSDRLKAHLVDLFDQGIGRFSFDFSAVEEIDSISLTLFVVFVKMLGKREGAPELEIVHCNDNIQKLFTLTRLDAHYMVM